MPYLQNEKARFQAEIQAAAAQIATLTSQVSSQQQVIEAAQARVAAAQATLAGVQAQLPPIQAAAADAEQQVEQANAAIAAHLEMEPDRTIDADDGKPPRPNPAWSAWNRTTARLQEQATQADRNAMTAHARLSEAAARLSEAAVAAQAAQRLVAEAAEALRVSQQGIAAARARQDAAQLRVANIDGWNDEIARDHFTRTPLERSALELSDEAAAIAEAHAVARVTQEIAEETLSSLTANRDRLAPALAAVNAQLPAASEALRAEQQVLAAALRRIQQHRQGGPRR
jgi:chromosome segregation ATPase